MSRQRIPNLILSRNAVRSRRSDGAQRLITVPLPVRSGPCLVETGGSRFYSTNQGVASVVIFQPKVSCGSLALYSAIKYPP